MDEWEYCPKCGTKLDPADSTCRACGAALPHATTVASGEQPTPSEDDADLQALADELREALAPSIQLLRPLGQGGMGTVFLARDPALKRLVVVKVLSPTLAHDPDARKRFAREAESAAAVSHPNVVNVYQVGELSDSGTSYFVMEHVDGPTLDEEFLEGVVVAEKRAKRIIGDIASALAAAHARGLVHRDIKPSNIMLDRETDRVVVLDFGISAAISPERKAAATKLTVQGHSIGTPQYMSPEQAAGEDVTGRSDVYSLGLVAFELLAGRPPFQETNSMALIAAHINKEPPRVAGLRPDLDPQLGNLIDRCLRKKPEERPSADETTRTLLPSAQPLVEWPPPGLEALRGKGSGLLRVIGLLAAFGVTFFVVMLMQPLTASPRWYEAGTSDLVEELVGASSIDLTPLWLFALLLTEIGAGIVMIVVLTRASHLASRMLWARRSCYSLPVVLDVAIDHRPDTEALINGTDIFTPLAPADRQRFLRLRRLRSGGALVATALAVVGPGLWLAGWIPGGTGMTVLLSAGEAMAVFAPAGIVLLAALLCSVPESRFCARLRRAPRFGKILRQPLVRRELVTGWLAASGRGAPDAGQPLKRRVSSLAPVVGALLLGALLLSVMSLTVVSSLTTLNLGFLRRDATSLLALIEDDSDSIPSWLSFDSMLPQAAALPDVGPVPDLEAARLLILLALHGRSVHPIWNVDSAELASIRAEYRHQGGRSPFANTAWELLPGQLPDSVREALARDTASPSVSLWRRVAHSAPLPALWFFDRDFAGATRELSFGDIQFYWATDLAQRNQAAAMLAIAGGDRTTALVRIRENLAVAQKLSSQPIASFAVRDAQDVLRVSESSLRELGRITQDQDLIAEADRVAQISDGLGSWFVYSSAPALMADLERAPGMLGVADTSLLPALRWSLLEAIAPAVCLNVREVLFGPSQRRWELLDRALVLAEDIPRTAEFIAVQQRRLARVERMSLSERVQTCLTGRGI